MAISRGIDEHPGLPKGLDGLRGAGRHYDVDVVQLQYGGLGRECPWPDCGADEEHAATQGLRE